MTYYKVLNEDGTPCHGGTGRWNLPDGSEPGAWMQRIYSLVQCKRGYHLCRDIQNLLSRLGPAIYLAEIDGAVLICNNEVVTETARLLHRLPWDDRTAQLFAADCAEHVLPIFEQARPGDHRPRRAIEAARRYATGETNETTVVRTVRTASNAIRTACRAAIAAGRNAARDATMQDAAQKTVWTTAWAAWAAAQEAAWAAAWAAKDTAQDAAWAAEDAAQDAARAAENAMQNSGFSLVPGIIAIARNTTQDAAWVTERNWQAAQLTHYLGLETQP